MFITEAMLAKLLRQDESEIKPTLQKIGGYGIIRYTPQCDEPQIVFLKNRVAAQDLKINLTAYNQRKEVFMARVQKMVGYVRAASCRSAFTGRYFGDENSLDCGVCDNCLQKRRSAVLPGEFSRMAEQILLQLAGRPCTAAELVNALKNYRSEKLWEVLRFLQAENKIHTTTQGQLSLTKTTTV